MSALKATMVRAPEVRIAIASIGCAMFGSGKPAKPTRPGTNKPTTSPPKPPSKPKGK